MYEGIGLIRVGPINEKLKKKKKWVIWKIHIYLWRVPSGLDWLIGELCMV